jgi:hypothetical protein
VPSCLLPACCGRGATAGRESGLAERADSGRESGLWRGLLTGQRERAERCALAAQRMNVRNGWEVVYGAGVIIPDIIGNTCRNFLARDKSCKITPPRLNFRLIYSEARRPPGFRMKTPGRWRSLRRCRNHQRHQEAVAPESRWNGALRRPQRPGLRPGLRS